jgi:hypothetical protein
MKTYTKNHLPSGTWFNAMKKTPTLMVRIEGPFQVETQEGVLDCQDGFIAIDSKGWPYPIAKEVKEETYVDLGEVKS